MKKLLEKERLAEIVERIRQISIEHGDLDREAGKLQNVIWDKERKKNDKVKCVCKHIRLLHGKSFSLNYTGGACKKCKCSNFMSK